MLDPSCFELLLGVSGVDPTIGCHQARRPSKDLLVMGYRINGLAVLFWVGEDLIARDQPSLSLVQGHQSSKLNKCTSDVPWNGAGVWLEEAEDDDDDDDEEDDE